MTSPKLPRQFHTVSSHLTHFLNKILTHLLDYIGLLLFCLIHFIHFIPSLIHSIPSYFSRIGHILSLILSRLHSYFIKFSYRLELKYISLQFFFKYISLKLHTHFNSILSYIGLGHESSIISSLYSRCRSKFTHIINSISPHLSPLTLYLQYFIHSLRSFFSALSYHTSLTFLILSLLIIPILSYQQTLTSYAKEPTSAIASASLPSSLAASPLIKGTSTTQAQFDALSEGIFNLIMSSELKSRTDLLEPAVVYPDDLSPIWYPYQSIIYKGMSVANDTIKIYVSYNKIAQYYSYSRNQTIEYNLTKFAKAVKDVLIKAELNDRDYIVIVEGEETEDKYIYLMLDKTGVIYTIHTGMIE